MSKYTMGSDPEFMLVGPDGQYRSAIDVIPGTKADPVKLPGGHLTFWDNVLAECCPRYGRTKEEVITNFRECFQGLADLVAPLRLKPQASHTYPAAACAHPGAQEFGCEPESNAYEMRTIMPPSCSSGNTFRSGGGHIHLGYQSGDEYPLMREYGRWWVARYLDWFVGLASLMMDNDPTSQARRKLYGGAGNLRIKEKYGIEYRTLSNFWLASPQIVSTIWDLCGLALEFVQNDPKAEDLWQEHQADIRVAIDNGDRKAGEKLYKLVAKKCGIPKGVLNDVARISEVKAWDFYREWNLKTK